MNGTSGSVATLDIASSGSLTLSTALTVNQYDTVNVAGTNGLTDNYGITLAGGSLTGAGTLSAATPISGWGTVDLSLASHTGAISANSASGVLDLQQALTGTLTPTVAAGGTLEFDASGNTASTVTLSGSISAPATLDIGAPALTSAASLTLTGALSVSQYNVINLNGSTLTNSRGINLGNTTTTLGGVIFSYGTSTLDGGTVGVTNTGDITVESGTLTLDHTLTNEGGSEGTDFGPDISTSAPARP